MKHLTFLSLLFFSLPSFAQDMDFAVGEATTSLGSVAVALTAIGGLLIGLAAYAVGMKWLKGMFFR